MKPRRPIRIVLVDDHRVVLSGLKRLLDDFDDLCVVGQATSHAEALAAVQTHQPDLLLLDVRLGGVDGFETCRQIKEQLPSVKILMLTSVGDARMILQAIRSGADGYLLKEIDTDELMAGIRAVAGGGVLFDPTMTRDIIRRLDQPTKPTGGLDRLTGRERKLLEAVAQGKTNRQIAETFNLSEGTVRNYMSLIFDKLGVSRRSQAVASYLKTGATADSPRDRG